MRRAILLPLSVLIVAGAGWIVCRVASWPAHGREMLLAGGICLAAGLAALVPLAIVDRRDVASVAQAALGGTVLQMLLCIALAAGLQVAGVRAEPTSFVWWMLAFYWASLLALVIVYIGAVRMAQQMRKDSSTGKSS